MKLSDRTTEKLNERKWYHRMTAITIVMSLLCAFFVPLDLIRPGVAESISASEASENSMIPNKAYDMSNDVTSLSVSAVSGGTGSGTTVEADPNSSVVSFKVNADFSIYDPNHDLINANQPYIYLTIPRDQLIVPDLGGVTTESNDNTKPWRDFLASKGITDSTVNGTMTVIPTGDNDYGYVLLEFNDLYLEYLKTTNGLVGGNLSFDASVDRDKSQDGDRLVSVGSQSLTVKFEDKVPSVEKRVDQVGTDENGCPILQWTLTLKDLYELNKYQIVDSMLSKAISFDCQYGVFSYNNGTLTFDEDYNEYGQFTITYRTKVSAEELASHSDPFEVTNKVSITGTDSKDEAGITITPDASPHISKSGTPDYEYTGSRDGEDPTKHYIYWTAIADINYGLSLKDKIIKESNSNAELVEVRDKNNQVLSKEEVFTHSGSEWKVNIDTNYLKMTFRTEVENYDPSKDINDVANKNTNTISIDGIDSNTPEVNYQKNAQHRTLKTGVYHSEEDANGQLTEYIEWTLKIWSDGSVNQNSNEIINGYTVYDSAFVDDKYEIVSVTAKNNYANVTINDKSQLFVPTGTANTVTINENLPDMDYLELKYRVQVSDSTLSGNRDANNGQTDVVASNAYKVEEDSTDTATVDVPGYAGKTRLSVNKNWANSDDPNRDDTTSTLTLQYRIGEDTNWKDFSTYKEGYEGTATLNANETWKTINFENLPAYSYDSATGTRIPIYYRVVETVNTPDGVDDLYELSSNYNEETGVKGSTNPNISLTNTWQGVNVTGVKYWRDDEGVIRPSVQLVLQKSTDNGQSWTNVGAALTPDSNSQVKWESLPKYENGVLIQYRVTEPNVPANYTSSISGSGNYWTVTNTYNNMTVSAVKKWVGADDDDKPQTVVVQLLQKRGEDGTWIAYSAEGVTNPITLNKADYANSADLLKWTGLPKNDGNGNTYYYKVEEIQTTVEQKEYNVSYSQESVSNGSAQITITNTWKKANLKVTKSWANDAGYEDKRPDITFVLMISRDNGTTWQEATVDDAVVTLKNDGTGVFYVDGNNAAEANAYTWKALETGENIRYKVVENISPTKMGDSDGQGIGYNTYYNGGNTDPVSVNSTDPNQRTISVSNVSNMVTFTVNKAWSGIDIADAPESVIVQVQWTTTPDDESSWTKFSDKEIYRYNGVYRAANWTYMPTKDVDGNQIYYRVVEVAARQQVSVAAGATTYEDKLDEYEVDIQKDNQNRVTVTNTWNNLNLSINKQWEDGTNESGYDTVIMKLQKKVGADGIWVDVENEDMKTVTRANGWQLRNAWTELPRTDDNGVAIYYRAVETGYTLVDDPEIRDVADSADFYTRPDSIGLNVTGSSKVTNVPKYITVGVQKKWGNISYSTKPSTITVSLYALVNGVSSWQKVSDLSTVVSDFVNVEAVQTITADGTYQWEHLPTKYVDDNNVEHDIFYRVEEAEIEGFNASYSTDRVSTNETVVITNNELAPYTKSAADPSAVDAIDNGDSPATLKSTNMDVIPGGVLSSEKLSEVTTQNVVINGETVECYLFKWRVDLLNNQSNDSSGTGMQYILYDTLTDGSVFYNDFVNYAITFRYNYTNVDYILGRYKDGNLSNNSVKVQYNDSFTEAKFTIANNVSYFTYFVATPKQKVDEALAATGSYTLNNYILEEAEKNSGSEPREETLKISGGNDAGYIDKINKSSKGTNNAGMAIMADGTAHYTLEVNSDGKYLSSGNTVSVTDNFRILDYTPKDGVKQEGRNVTLKAELKDVVVYEYDENGKKKILSSDQYSYTVDTDDNGVYAVEEDYFTKFTNSNLRLYSGGEIIIISSEYDIPAGLDVVVRLSHPAAAGKKAALTNVTTKDPANLGQNKNGAATVSLLSDSFDGSGTILVKIHFNETYAVSSNGSVLVGFNVTADDQKVEFTSKGTVYSAILKSETPVKNYVAKFTLPDGGHYQVNYDYVLVNEDGTPLSDNSIVTLHNESAIHTSGGDKWDESEKTSYNVQNSQVQTYAGQEMNVEKVDIGNKSLADLNATFKLARYDTVLGKWVYASGFPFKVTTVGNNQITSSTVHTVEFGDLTDEDGTIPVDAAEMVLTGRYTLDIAKDVLYKIIEVKSPDNYEGYTYIPVPYELNDTTVAGNAENTYYFVYETSDDKLNELKAEAGISSGTEVRSISVNNSALTVPNVRLISIGAEKIWEQDPNSAAQEVKVAVQLWRSDTKDINDAVLVPNQEQYIDEADRVNYSTDIVAEGAYVLDKDSSGKWQHEAIWKGLPDGNIETEMPYYYFIKEVAYLIGEKWYIYDSDADSATYNKYVDKAAGKVYEENGVEAEYRPSYIDDATNDSGVIKIVNSRKMLVKKEWQDRNGVTLMNVPATEIEFSLYGIKADGSETEIILPVGSNKLTAPTWTVEVPQNLLSAEYVRYRLEEKTEMEDYIVSDIYTVNGTVGVMTLINKDTNPTYVNFHVVKTWEDGNDIHDEDDYVVMTLYQYTGTSVVDDAFIKKFVEDGNKASGVTRVSLADQNNPITLNGTEDSAWEGYWTNLPFKVNGKKAQYFVVETHQKTGYTASYTIDGNTNYLEERTASVTNAQPGSLILKKQWRDIGSGELISNADYGDVQFQLYQKETTTAVTTTTVVTTTTTAATNSIKGDPANLTQPIKIMAIGDSITDDYTADLKPEDGEVIGGYRKYLYQELIKTYHKSDNSPLIDMVGTRGGNDSNKNWDDNHEGYSMYAIQQYSGRAGIYETIDANDAVQSLSPDIVLLLIGTNDVLDNNLSNITYNENGQEKSLGNAKERLKKLIQQIYSQNEDAILFVSEVPPLRYNAIADYRFDSYGKSAEEKQSIINGVIAEYNGYVAELVNELSSTHDIHLLSVNSQLTLDDIRVDGIHPNASGYEKMGEYYAEQIKNYLQPTEPSETTTTTEESESSETTTTTTTAEVDPITKHDLYVTVTNPNNEIEGLSEDGIVTLSKDNKWTVSLTGLDPAYEYYAVEIGDKVEEYIPIYLNNGQQPGSGIPIVVENHVEGEHITVRAEKVWDYPSGMPVNPPDSITLTLQQFTGRITSTPEKTYEKTITAADNWTAEWTDLPASKLYTIAETEVDGWITTYETLDPIEEDGTEIRRFKVTNTIETGSLQVVKHWFGDANVDSVQVKIYRVSEDQLEAAESLDYVMPGVNDVSNGLSSNNRLYSMSRTRMLLSKTVSMQTQALPKPKLNLAAVNGGALKTASGESVEKIENPPYSVYGYGSEISILDKCNGHLISAIEVEYSSNIEEVHSDARIWVKITDSDGNFVEAGSYGKSTITVIDSKYVRIELDSYSSQIDCEKLSKMQLQCFGMLKSGVYDCIPIKEVRFCYTPTETLTIDKSAITMIEGDEATITAGTPTGTVHWSNTGYEEYFDFVVDEENNTATITAKKATPTNTPAVLTVNDDSATKTADITIEALAITNTDTEIKEGNYIDLKSNKAGAEFSIPQGTTGASLSNGRLTGLIPGQTVEVTVTNGTATATKIFTIVAPDDFTVTSNAIAHSGKTVSLNLSTSNSVSVTVPSGWSYEQKGNILEVTVGESNGTVSVTYQGITKTSDITVTPLIIANPVEEMSINSSKEFSVDSSTIATGSTGITWTVKDPDNAVTYSTIGNILRIETAEVLSDLVTVEADDGKGGIAIFEFKIDVTEAPSNVPAGLKKYPPFESVTITKDGGWVSETLNNLPLTDGRGNKYLYFIEENTPDNCGYKVISYNGNGESLEDLAGKIELTNVAQQKEEPDSVELPESGGSGTQIYYITGALLLLLSAAGYVMFKHRRWFSE